MEKPEVQQQIPVSTSMEYAMLNEHMQFQKPVLVKRTIFISVIALLVALAVGYIAKGLVMLVSFFTNIFFFGKFSAAESAAAENHLGLWVIVIPVIGGIIVGLMARYGSKAIRGHGIPEAMEKILTGESKIPPLITFLKPLSAAFSIGTGGPFGAEGPIIATGGALGSFVGQTLRITSQERKVLLAAGATSGMTAIFGTPFAAILLAIELLLFEFQARSFIPVVIACVIGACMHFLLFTTSPVFPMPQVEIPGTEAIIAFAVIGLICGILSVFITKSVYFIEDAFEKLPIHWMWWPAIGGVAVGVVGYFFPDTLGVGYYNITHALSGKLLISVLLPLCIMKFISWSISLGSGTSGGTLAPLLTIGSCLGASLGIGITTFFPHLHIDLSLAALVGMAALFAGSTRAVLTSIAFALETTMQENTLFPLIASCIISYLVSFAFMKTTIMTEKISRRGVITPEDLSPDVLRLKRVSDILETEEREEPLISLNNNLGEIREWLKNEGLHYSHETLLVVDANESNFTFAGMVKKKDVLNPLYSDAKMVSEILVTNVHSVSKDDILFQTLQFMAETGHDVLPVLDPITKNFTGSVSYPKIMSVYRQSLHHDSIKERYISPTTRLFRIITKGRQIFTGSR